MGNGETTIIALAITLSALLCTVTAHADEQDDPTTEELLLEYETKARGYTIAGVIHLVGGVLLGAGAAAIAIDHSLDVQAAQGCDDCYSETAGIEKFAVTLSSALMGGTGFLHFMLGVVLTALGDRYRYKARHLGEDMASLIPKVSFANIGGSGSSIGLTWQF